MLATSIGGKLRGEETGARESGTLSFMGRDLGGCIASGSDGGRSAGEPFGNVAFDLPGKFGGSAGSVDEKTPDASCVIGGAINSVSGVRSEAELPRSRKSATPGTG